MQRIYKYGLGIDGTVITIEDKIEKFLHIENQDGWPMVWALINDDVEKGKYDIYSIGTGWDIDVEDTEYIGTIIDKFGYVWHYFVKRLDDSPIE